MTWRDQVRRALHRIERVSPNAADRLRTLSRMPEQLLIDQEVHGWRFVHPLLAIHFARVRWVRSLPMAERIVDLGGTAIGSRAGALVVMGYPYAFRELTIVDLPQDQRHPRYRDETAGADDFIHDGKRIRYRYTSMTDLSGIEDASIDLVMSGESFEHVPERDGPRVLAECLRVLKPGGSLALDTPNARATRLQQPELIDPDHKIEYTHPQLRALLEQAGFFIQEAKGLCWLPRSFAHNAFDLLELNEHPGIYDDIESCYLLAYRCRRP
jgi:SAM-dependent methyltransferase